MKGIDPKVYLIEDDKPICEALNWLFTSVALDVEIYSSGADYLNVFDINHCGCIVLDIRLPGISGLEVQDELNRLHNHMPIIIITGHGDVPLAIRAMKAGAFDFFTKPFDSQALLEQVQKAIAIDIKRINLNQHLLIIQGFKKLTLREKQLLELIMEGKQNKQIGHELTISISTVEMHRASLMRKMKSKTLVDLVKNYLIIKNKFYI